MGEEKIAVVETNVAEEKAEKNNVEDKIKDMTAASDELAMQIGVLTEERDCARGREEELFDTLTAREEELMNTNDGYVYLTEHLHEVREELEEKYRYTIDTARARDTLTLPHAACVFTTTAR